LRSAPRAPLTGHKRRSSIFRHSGHSITSSLTKSCVLGDSRDPAARTSTQPAVDKVHRRAARYALGLLLARIYEVFPLVKA